MTDAILIVKNSYEFHRQNLLLNPSHYSILARFFGPKIVSKINNIGTNVYYNVHISTKEGVNF